MKQPNFLFLFPDQHRGDWMPYNKETFNKLGIDELPIKMPNVERLMNEGVVFTRAVTPSPLCAPARACLASGLRYNKCGVASNGVDYPLEQKTFYTIIKENGYRVGGVGKFDLHKPTHWWGLDGRIDDFSALGFTDAIDNEGKIDAIVSGKDEPKGPYMKYLYDNNLASIHIDDMKARLGPENSWNTTPTPLQEEAYCDNWLTSNGINMLRNFPKESPWFLAVNFTGPHDPWDITEKMKKEWGNTPFPLPNKGEAIPNEVAIAIRQNYAAMLENIDKNIGLLIDEVKKREELDNTIIIYTSDHGEMLGDWGKFGKSQHERGSIHIPLVISGPGIEKAVYSDALVELQDLTATLLEYAGLHMKEAKDSMSLKRCLEGKTKNHRQYQVSELKVGNSIEWKVIADERYKLVINEDKQYMLYDLISDPWQNINIANENQSIIERFIAEK